MAFRVRNNCHDCGFSPGSRGRVDRDQYRRWLPDSKQAHVVNNTSRIVDHHANCFSAVMRTATTERDQTVTVFFAENCKPFVNIGNCRIGLSAVINGILKKLGIHSVRKHIKDADGHHPFIGNNQSFFQTHSRQIIRHQHMATFSQQSNRRRKRHLRLTQNFENNTGMVMNFIEGLIRHIKNVVVRRQSLFRHPLRKTIVFSCKTGPPIKIALHS